MTRSTDGKSAFPDRKPLRTISDISEWLNIKQHMHRGAHEDAAHGCDLLIDAELDKVTETVEGCGAHVSWILAGLCAA